MFDFSRIAAQNGWQISFLGISIVFTGLVTLSIVISQLHKLLLLWEKRERVLKRIKDFSFKGRIDPDEELIAKLPEDVQENAKHIKLLLTFVGQPINLPDLTRLALKRGIEIEHETIHHLLQNGLLSHNELGLFVWQTGGKKRVLAEE